MKAKAMAAGACSDIKSNLAGDRNTPQPHAIDEDAGQVRRSRSDGALKSKDGL